MRITMATEIKQQICLQEEQLSEIEMDVSANAKITLTFDDVANVIPINLLLSNTIIVFKCFLTNLIIKKRVILLWAVCFLIKSSDP